MKTFDGGIRYYTAANVDIYFPEDDVCCRACPLLWTEYGTKRDVCRKTAEYIPNPDRMIGGMCPLAFDENNFYIKKEETKNADNQ